MNVTTIGLDIAKNVFQAHGMDQKTALINQVRGLLGKYGIVLARGPSQVRRGMRVLLGKDDPRLSGIELLADLNGQLRALDERIANYEARVKAASATDERSAKLAELPGIGALTATALTAVVHDGKAFDNGRQMAASLGLPPEHSSGGKQRLMGITKRGNTYVRTLLIHGARTVLRHAEARPTGSPDGLWPCKPGAVRMSPPWHWPTNRSHRLGGTGP